VVFDVEAGCNVGLVLWDGRQDTAPECTPSQPVAVLPASWSGKPVGIDTAIIAKMLPRNVEHISAQERMVVT
jgi:hypothetical protein